MYSITNKEFSAIRELVYELAGINLTDAKKALVVSRLSKRLRQYNLQDFGQYYALVKDKRNVDERRAMVDLITTNETYFFREGRHFQELADFATHRSARPGRVRVWSAACSTGEEAFSIAMTLADRLDGRLWDVYATDISTRVLDVARAGLYPLDASDKIPKSFLSRFCLKGVRSQVGFMLMAKDIRSRIRFERLNLHATWPDIGMFDAIFLRNVMIYFDMPTKQRLLQRLWRHLNPGGLLFIGHSETLNRVNEQFVVVRPSVYQKL